MNGVTDPYFLLALSAGIMLLVYLTPFITYPPLMKTLIRHIVSGCIIIVVVESYLSQFFPSPWVAAGITLGMSMVGAALVCWALYSGGDMFIMYFLAGSIAVVLIASYHDIYNFFVRYAGDHSWFIYIIFVLILLATGGVLSILYRYGCVKTGIKKFICAILLSAIAIMSILVLYLTAQFWANYSTHLAVLLGDPLTTYSYVDEVTNTTMYQACAGEGPYVSVNTTDQVLYCWMLFSSADQIGTIVTHPAANLILLAVAVVFGTLFYLALSLCCTRRTIPCCACCQRGPKENQGRDELPEVKYAQMSQGVKEIQLDS